MRLPARSATASDAPVVWTPSLNRFLDVRPGELLREGTLDQLRYLGIRCKAQRDELVFGQLRNAGAQRLGQQSSKPQPLFQANHPVLHLKRVKASLEECDYRGHRDDKE